LSNPVRVAIDGSDAAEKTVRADELAAALFRARGLGGSRRRAAVSCDRPA
jgi:hypothetical protein